MKPEQPLSFHEPQNVVRTLQRMYKVLRGNISYGNLTPQDTGRNIDCWPVQNVEFTGGDPYVQVAHGLNRIPVGFHVAYQESPAVIYAMTTVITIHGPEPLPWTTQYIYANANMATTAILLIF